MNIPRKTITAIVCGFAQTMGLVIILVISSMFMTSRLLQDIMNPYIILIFSLLIIFPLISRRLNRCDGQDRIIGWTLIGLGAQMLFLPLPLLFLILKFPSSSGLLFGGIILTGLVVFGVPAGLLAAAVGINLLKRRRKL